MDNKNYSYINSIEYKKSLSDPRSYKSTRDKEYPVEGGTFIHMEHRLIPKGSIRSPNPKWELIKSYFYRPYWKWIGEGMPDRYGSFSKYVCGYTEELNSWQPVTKEKWCPIFEGPVKSNGTIPLEAKNKFNSDIKANKEKKNAKRGNSAQSAIEQSAIEQSTIEQSAIEQSPMQYNSNNNAKEQNAIDTKERYDKCVAEFGKFASSSIGGKRRINKKKKTRRQKKK